MSDSRRQFLQAGYAAVAAASAARANAGSFVAVDESELREAARKAFEAYARTEPVAFRKTTHPGAQWFPDAAFGLFMHWGIHSVAGLDPSWSMKKNISWYTGENPERYQGREKYYALAREFNPRSYEPERWLSAAKQAGMNYAVLTAKHHDGFCLWPSAYGEWNTRRHMNGRDLLAPFIAACRRTGLKTGFYFSGPDWSFPGFPVSMDDAVPDAPPPGAPLFDNAAYERYAIGQLSELLTRYGPIDLIWFDGKVANYDRTTAWIRGLHPHIVIGREGDIDHSYESGHKPVEPPAGWWEHCMHLGGHWGHAPATDIEPASVILERLVLTRAWRGNFLVNLGPRPDGTMRPEFYHRLGEIAGWMEHSRESVIGAAGRQNWQNFSACPVTRRGVTWYMHVLPNQFGPLQMYDIRERPLSVSLLRTGEPLTHRYHVNRLVIDLPYAKRGRLDEVIAIRFEREPDPRRQRY